MTTTPSKTTTNAGDGRVAAVFTLPDGRVMDAKNTLQSFAVPTPTGSGMNSTSTATVPSPAFTLPDGRIMDAKNTLQSFAAVPTPILATKRDDVAAPSLSSNPGSTVVVQGVAVHSIAAVEGEIFNPEQQQCAPPSLPPQEDKKNWTIWSAIAVLCCCQCCQLSFGG